MKFNQLPETLQKEICGWIHDTEDLSKLSQIGRDNLNALTPAEMFDAFLSWHGIIGYTEKIMDAHYNIFKKEARS